MSRIRQLLEKKAAKDCSLNQTSDPSSTSSINPLDVVKPNITNSLARNPYAADNIPNYSSLTSEQRQIAELQLKVSKLMKQVEQMQEQLNSVKYLPVTLNSGINETPISPPQLVTADNLRVIKEQQGQLIAQSFLKDYLIIRTTGRVHYSNMNEAFMKYAKERGVDINQREVKRFINGYLQIPYIQSNGIYEYRGVELPLSFYS